MKWAFYHPAFIEITDDVNNAASVDPNAPPNSIGKGAIGEMAIGAVG